MSAHAHALTAFTPNASDPSLLYPWGIGEIRAGLAPCPRGGFHVTGLRIERLAAGSWWGKLTGYRDDLGAPFVWPGFRIRRGPRWEVTPPPYPANLEGVWRGLVFAAVQRLLRVATRYRVTADLARNRTALVIGGGGRARTVARLARRTIAIHACRDIADFTARAYRWPRLGITVADHGRLPFDALGAGRVAEALPISGAVLDREPNNIAALVGAVYRALVVDHTRAARQLLTRVPAIEPGHRGPLSALAELGAPVRT
jgi:hypothetical protein